MKIVDGVELHLIKNEKFKMNHITFRFSGDFNQKTVARRVLVAQFWQLLTPNTQLLSALENAWQAYTEPLYQLKCQRRD